MLYSIFSPILPRAWLRKFLQPQMWMHHQQVSLNQSTWRRQPIRRSQAEAEAPSSSRFGLCGMMNRYKYIFIYNRWISTPINDFKISYELYYKFILILSWTTTSCLKTCPTSIMLTSMSQVNDIISCTLITNFIFWPRQRHHLLYTDHQLHLLAEAKTWFMDATFRVVNQSWMQLFTINFFVRSGDHMNQVPLAFCLVASKRKQDYYEVKHYDLRYWFLIVL